MKPEVEHQPNREPQDASSDFQIFLQMEFLDRCRVNSRYNVSAFARFLSVDASTLSKILKGQRKLRKQAIRKLCVKLGIDPIQTERFESSSLRVTTRNRIKALKSDQVDANYKQMNLDTFQIVSDWYHYAILELMRIKHFRGDLKWIARVLKISVTEVQLAIERLQRVEMLEIKSNGQWMDLSSGYTSTLGNQFTAGAFRKLQTQVLEKAKIALEEVPLEKRSQTSMLMAIDRRKLPEAKRMIVEFQRKLNKFLSVENASVDEVYLLGVSLYPISEVEDNLKKENKS